MLIIYTLIVALLAVTLIYQTYRLRSPRPIAEQDWQWFDEFSMRAYAPMHSLLDDAEFRWMESQPGYVPALGKRFRRERRRLLQSYLGQASQDFGRLYRLARAKSISGDVPADFAKNLARYEFEFFFALTTLRCRLAFPLGGNVPHVDVRGILARLEGMEAVLRTRGLPDAI